MTATRRNRGVSTSAALAALLVCAAPCATAQSVCDDLRGLPINFQVDWIADIKPIVNDLFGGRCTSCHNAGAMAGGLNLSDDPVDGIYNIVNNIVLPGDVSNSRMFDKINCDPPLTGGLRMPADQSPLTIPQQALIYDWIEQGALGEPKDPIFRDNIFRDGGESLRWY